MLRKPLVCGVALATLTALILTGCSTGGEPSPSPASSSDADNITSAPTMIVVDASASMNASDAPGPRINAAKSAVDALVSSLPGQAQLGVVAFGATVPSTRGAIAGCRDVSTVSALASIDQTDPRPAVSGIVAQGWSPVGSALQSAAEPLSDGSGSIVLVSDGEANCQPDPCATAQQIHEQHPDITISAIGFKTDSEQLQCVAAKGGGVFVTADNTAQLVARLQTVQAPDDAAAKLSSDGLQGITLGESIGDIRKEHSDFPAASDTGTAVVEWRDCSWHFVDGELTSIEPHAATETIDGVTAGTSMSRVVDLYGPPVKVDGDSHRAYFVANRENGRALVVTYDGDPQTGTVKTIVLCTCLPTESSSTTTQTPFASGPVTADTPFTFGGIGSVVVGLPEDQLSNAGVSSEPTTSGTCDVIYLPGGARSPTVYVKGGKVVGAKIYDGLAYAENGIKVGDTLAKVKAAYPGASSEVIDRTAAGVGVLLLHKPTNPDKYLGFSVAPGTADSDSATITGIAGGSKDLASFFEVCSG